MDWAAGRLTAGGKALDYACWGPPPDRSSGQAPDQSPTLVLLHEGLGCIALWRDFPLRLAQATGCGVFAYSRAGYGRSDPVPLPRPLDYMTGEAQQVLPQVLDQIGARRVILLGHSDGATIAAIHGGTVADDRVQGLVLIAPHFFTEPFGLAAIAEARIAYDRDGLRGKLARYHDDVDCAFRGWNDAWLDPGFRDWNVADVMDGLPIPALAIQGQGDAYGSLAQIDHLPARCAAPVDTLILPDCGHAPHLEHSAQVVEAVQRFCTKLARIEG